jgi:hypothetical protein
MSFSMAVQETRDQCCRLWSYARAVGKGRFLLGKERKLERKGVVRRNEIKRVTRAPTTDVDPQGRKDQSTGAVARIEERRRERMANRERRGKKRRGGGRGDL